MWNNLKIQTVKTSGWNKENGNKPRMFFASYQDTCFTKSMLIYIVTEFVRWNKMSDYCSMHFDASVRGIDIHEYHYNNMGLLTPAQIVHTLYDYMYIMNEFQFECSKAEILKDPEILKATADFVEIEDNRYKSINKFITHNNCKEQDYEKTRINKPLT